MLGTAFATLNFLLNLIQRTKNCFFIISSKNIDYLCNLKITRYFKSEYCETKGNIKMKNSMMVKKNMCELFRFIS